MSREAIKANVARKLVAILAVAGLVLLALPAANASATVSGQVYDWSTFDAVNNAVIEVYSTPSGTMTDKMVSKTGSYSFSLPAGTYMIKANYGLPGTQDELVAEENATLTDGNSYRIDLILFPTIGLEDLSAFIDNDTNASHDTNVTPSPPAPTAAGVTPVPPWDNQASDTLIYLAIGAVVLAIAIVIIALFMLARSRTLLKPVITEEKPPVLPQAEPLPELPAPEPAPVQQQKPEVRESTAVAAPPDLPDDCKEVIAIMEKNGGRITQLDLRKALPYSEAKVSLIVSDLESRGLVKKIKKGRGNVLILIRPEEKPRD